MAHSRSALKRWRQNTAHRARNKPARTAARSSVKTAHAAIEAGDRAQATPVVASAASVLDRAAKRGVIHRNAASRHKARLMKHLNRTAATDTRSEPAAPARGRKAPPSRTARTGARSTSRAAKPKK